MQIKIAGIIFLFAGCTGLGWNRSREMKQRLNNLKNMRQLLLLLKGEISYGNMTLPESFFMIYKKLPDPLGGFAKELADKMENEKGKDFYLLFQDTAEQKLKNSLFTREELEEFCLLGRQLGFLDRQNQLRQLEIYEKELEQKIEQYLKELPEKRKLCEALGIIGGLFLAVLFI